MVMYLSGPSVLACCAGKAVLILILPPLFLSPPAGRQCPLHCSTMPKWYCCGNPLAAENGNPSCSLCRPFPGGALGGGRDSLVAITSHD
ncbi:hypothetical protein F5883DRAFT_576192 [Diaporthe sp. PMI_573]|nr:hypothetical protein F5883DRAFT_576192 [Diaporthaceae sp. PMI_573]